jgi:hypothetical protein
MTSLILLRSVNLKRLNHETEFKYFDKNNLLLLDGISSLPVPFGLGGIGAKLWIEETNELDVFETEISWNLNSLVAIAIATAVRKKSLAAVATAISFSETPPRRERELDRCSRFVTPRPLCVQCPNL